MVPVANISMSSRQTSRFTSGKFFCLYAGWSTVPQGDANPKTGGPGRGRIVWKTPVFVRCVIVCQTVPNRSLLTTRRTSGNGFAPGVALSAFLLGPSSFFFARAIAWIDRLRQLASPVPDPIEHLSRSGARRCTRLSTRASSRYPPRMRPSPGDSSSATARLHKSDWPNRKTSQTLNDSSAIYLPNLGADDSCLLPCPARS